MAVLIRFVPILAQAALHYPNGISISQWGLFKLICDGLDNETLAM